MGFFGVTAVVMLVGGPAVPTSSVVAIVGGPVVPKSAGVPGAWSPVVTASNENPDEAPNEPVGDGSSKNDVLKRLFGAER